MQANMRCKRRLRITKISAVRLPTHCSTGLRFRPITHSPRTAKQSPFIGTGGPIFMQREEKSRLREPALQRKNQIDAHMYVVMDVNNLWLQPSQDLVQSSTILKIHLRCRAAG